MENVMTAADTREFLSHVLSILQLTPKFGGRDEDLRNILDAVLRMEQRQNEMEQKMDQLTDDVKKIADDVNNSKEMKNVLDTVQTSVGYSTLFVKDFYKIHYNMQAMNVALPTALENIRLQNRCEINEVRDQIKSMEENFLKLAGKERNLNELVQKIQQHLNGAELQLKNTDNFSDRKRFLNMDVNCCSSKNESPKFSIEKSLSMKPAFPTESSTERMSESVRSPTDTMKTQLMTSKAKKQEKSGIENNGRSRTARFSLLIDEEKKNV